MRIIYIVTDNKTTSMLLEGRCIVADIIIIVKLSLVNITCITNTIL